MSNQVLTQTDFHKIKELYLSKVVVPHIKPSKQFILCPVGLVGAGKSTVVVPLSAKMGLVRISHDEIRQLLNEHNFDYNRSKEIAIDVIKNFIEKGYSVCIDANCGSRETFELIKKVEAKYSIVSIWIHINPPEDFIINKLRNFNHTWLFKNGAEAVKNYREYKEKYGDGTDLGIDFAYVFDTSKSNILEQINEAEDLILKKLG
jgi:hypothetical protein